MPQVYRRIANPFMPNGTPNLTNSPSPYYAPGELGCAFSDQNTGYEYLRVQLDSGATSATAVGVVASGQLAFWKNQSTSTVTNDVIQCDVGSAGAINRVAGVFQTAVSTTPGINGTDGQPQLYMCDLMIRGVFSCVAASALKGAQATANTTAAHADMVYTTGVTTAPVSQVLGVFASGITSGNASVNVSIGFAE
jgi:hypothetical protein